jgi:hypothetical protein
MLERVRVAAASSRPARSSSTCARRRFHRRRGAAEGSREDLEAAPGTTAHARVHRPASRRAKSRSRRRTTFPPSTSRRFHFHRPAARAVQQLGADAAALLQARHRVANHGESGESLRGFIGERRLGQSAERHQARRLPVHPDGAQRPEGEGRGRRRAHHYKSDLKRFIADVRQHGATPVLVSPMNRLTFDADGKITNSLGDYPEAVRQAGKEENAAVIDLNAMSKPFYEALGPVDAHLAFAGNDTTHHDNYGSYELAKCIVEGNPAGQTADREVPDRARHRSPSCRLSLSSAIPPPTTRPTAGGATRSPTISTSARSTSSTAPAAAAAAALSSPRDCGRARGRS